MNKSIFLERINTFENQLKQHEKAATRFSLLRAVAFISMVGLLILYFSESSYFYLVCILLPLVLFIIFVSRYIFHEGKKAYFRQLIKINQEEIQRIQLNLSEFKTGSEYLEKDHPYQYDLDIFGDHSLFQLLNHCALEDSEKLLARCLSYPSDLPTISERQNAIQELAEKINWFQDFLANTRIAVSKRKKEEPSVSAKALLNWAQKPTTIKNTLIWKIIGVVLSIQMLATIGLAIAGLASYQIIYVGAALNTVFLYFTISRLHPLIKGIDKAHYVVSTYYQAVTSIEHETFKSPQLISLQKSMLEGGKASHHILQLSKITQRINSRSNPLYFASMDLLFLADVFLLADLISWKKENTSHINKWLSAVHEFEALVSVAAFAQSHTNVSWPSISEHAFHLNATKIAHPLIPRDQMVTNDYEVIGEGSVDIITGSNMSGKSTFQRTLGVNMVLANMGGPVSAERFTWSPCLIFTSMRTKDNLEENTSSFYAELKRIRQLLNLLDQQPAFFLLDEILKGTNSEDRHKGGIALALKLTQKPAFGLISTHDLALGNLANDHFQIRNFSFNSQIINDQIKFDYLLTPGICKSFNASQLMKNMGIIDP